MDTSEWQKRVSIIITLIGLVIISILGRLYQKAIIEHGESVKAAESQYAFRKEVVGERGEIIVRDGTSDYYPLATNERRYQLIIVPSNVIDASKTAHALAEIIDLKESDIFDKINNKKRYIPPLQHRLTRDQADRIASLHLHGVLLYPEVVRTYPEGQLAAKLLGFVNNEGKGNYGLEGAFDTLLRGAAGYQVGEKDNQGRLINLGDEVKAKDGDTIVLTLDRETQHFVEQSLRDAIKEYEADSGSVVIEDVKTGAIIASAGEPGFNPNEFNKVEDPALFFNPVTSAVWEPGSIMKPLVMALALDKGLVEPETKNVFSASVRVLNHDIFTAEKKAFGEETMTQVLENSDNVAMVWLADKLTSEGEYEGLKKFGFGQAPKFDLQNNVAGTLPAVKTWNDLTRATVSFGQGVSVSPLQMVMAYSALANKGVMMQPYLVSEVLDDKGTVSTAKPTALAQVVSEDTSRKISLMLESVVLRGHGKRAQVSGFRIGGKTGTAQVPKSEGGYYDDRHIGSFAGYFPLSDPQYAMVVKLDNPKSVNFAESSAGPTFGQIAAWILHHKEFSPDKP